jgi:hypothetical protein
MLPVTLCYVAGEEIYDEKGSFKYFPNIAAVESGRK